MARDLIQAAGDNAYNYGYSPAYGGTPIVPDPNASATASITGGLGNLGSLYGLTGGLDTAAGAGAISSLGQEIPGVSGLITGTTGNISNELAGKVPQDVIDLLSQHSAEIGAGRGMGPMAPSTNAAYLRALGLTSLGEKQRGAADLNSLMTAVPRAPQFDPSRMIVSPEEQQMWNYLRQTLAKSPNPAAAAAANVGALTSGLNTGAGAFPGMPAPRGGTPGADPLGFSTSELPGRGGSDNMGTVVAGGTGVTDPSDPYANWMRQFGSTFTTPDNTPPAGVTQEEWDQWLQTGDMQGDGADSNYYDANE
jgi:hypothetical protein